MNLNPHSLIINPSVNAEIERNSTFLVDVNVAEFALGSTSNSKKEYLMHPQSLNEEGLPEGHVHLSVQFLSPLGAYDGSIGTEVPRSQDCEFFKANVQSFARFGPSHISRVTFEIKPGLTKRGWYRICSFLGTTAHGPIYPNDNRVQAGKSFKSHMPDNDCIRIKVLNERDFGRNLK